jgi:hypothetical protein
VPDAVDVVEKKVGERLPDSKKRHNSGRYEAEPLENHFVGRPPGEVVDKCLENIDAKVRNQQILHTRCDVKVEADPVALDGRPRHIHQV